MFKGRQIMKKRNLLLFISSTLLALSMSACTVETGLSQSSSGSDSKSSEKQSSEPAPAPSSDASSEQPSSSEAPGPQVSDRFYWSLNGSNYLEVDYNTKEDIYDNDHNDIGDQFAITLSSLNAGDVFTFKHNDEQVKPWPDAGDDENINNAKRNDQELIEVIKSSANTETLYFKYYPVDGFNPDVHGYTLWLTGYSGEVIPPDPQEDKFYWKLNDGEYTLFDVSTKEDISDNDQNDIGDQFSVEFAELKKTDIITFKHNDAQVKPWADAGDAENINNAKRNADELIEVKCDCENATLYFKYYPEDTYHPGQHGYALWLTGYNAEAIPEDEITYTCTNLPNWITNDGCVIFVWVWGPDDGGSWKNATFINDGAALTFQVANELNGFLCARCVAGTTQPDWSIKSGDAVGRIYNKTDDISCQSGVYSYVCSNWVEYK